MSFCDVCQEQNKSMNKNHCKIKNKYGNIKIEQNRPKNHIKKYTNIKSEIKKGEKRKMKKNKGITLIALVITIIVLLILAGVAIAMLSGENGILRKAAEAKTETEQAQKEEETRLTDMEITTSFLTNNSKYKCRYGFITGLETTDTVKNLEDALPTGYKVALKYKWVASTDEGEDEAIEESEKSTTVVSTGMAVMKNGEIIARTVLFGDIRCDGGINANDYGNFKAKYAMNSNEIKEDFRKAAVDLNCDGKINGEDLKNFKLYISSGHELGISQNLYVSNPDKIILDQESLLRYAYVQKVFEDGSETDIYTLQYDEKIDNYNFKMKTSETKVEDFLSTLAEGGKIKRNEQEIEATENVQNGDEVIYSYKEKEVHIGKIIIE